MARGAKLLNQLAHLQLLQRCAASWRRGRALIGIIDDALGKSEALILPAQSKVSCADCLTSNALSLALSSFLFQTRLLVFSSEWRRHNM